jgi:hypothetical protein
VARELSLIEQTLRNCVKATDTGKLNGAGAKVVTRKQVELSRLRLPFVIRLGNSCSHRARREERRRFTGYVPSTCGLSVGVRETRSGQTRLGR